MFNHTFRHASTTLAFIIGVILLVLGLIGFVSNPIFGIFEATTLSNLLLVIFGLGGIFYASASEGKARNFSLVLGVLFLVAAIYGYLFPNTEFLGFVPTTFENNALNLVVSLLYFGTGALAGVRNDRTSSVYSNTANSN